MTCSSKCASARRNARVDGDHGAAGVTRMPRYEKGDRSPDFFRRRAAAERQRLEQIFPIILAAGAILGLLLHQADETIRLDRPRAERHDADAVLGADAAERLRECGERRIAGDPA